jgi:hypothetical protein
MQDTLVLKRIPDYIIEEIEEYTEQTKQGRSRCMKWENIRILLGMAVINNRITRAEADIIEEKYCLENKKDELFTEDNLLEISCLVDSNYEKMKKEKVYSNAQEKLFELNNYFEKELSKENYEKLQEFSDYMNTVANCESYIAYEIGQQNPELNLEIE